MGARRRPGPDGTGTAPHPDDHSGWSGELLGWVRTQADRTAEAAESFSETVSGTGKSALLGILDVLPLKPDSPCSTRLLRHYVEGSGEPYELVDIPEQWQKWIVAATKAKPGRHPNLNPYNSGIYDLRNSLGHFDVIVTEQEDSRIRVYEIEKVYEFGFKHHDRDQRGRHGFPLGQLNETTIHLLEFVLPSAQHWNPGGFRERWEVTKAGKESILHIPQSVLAQQGKPFKVHGKFLR
jgi:hypothetical protein